MEKNEKKENEIVKYNNFMNSLSLGSLQSTELNILMALCEQFCEQGTKELTFSYAELRQLIGDTHISNAELYGILKSINMKLLSIKCELENDDEIVQFVLFTDFTTNKKFEWYKVGVNEKFAFVLNELKANFTVFELKEFVSLKSKYSKNLYRLLKQFNKTNWRKFEINDFKEKMGIPKSYAPKRIMYEIIRPSIEELKNIFLELQCDTCVARKKGSPIVGYEFRWKEAVNDDIPGQMKITDFLEDPNISQDEKNKTLKIANDILNKKPKKNKKTSYSNQRTYDYDALEKELLNKF